MDRALAWFLFVIFFIVAICVSREVLINLQDKTLTSNLGNSANRQSVGPTSIDAASDLYFESHSREKEAGIDMRNSNSTGAFSELNNAIELMERLKDDHPEFRPVHTQDRLLELKRKKDSWEAEIKIENSPISTNSLAPGIVDPAIEVPTISSFDLGDIDLPGMGDFQIGVPRIGFGNLRVEQSPGFIKWDEDVSSSLSPLQDIMFSENGGDHTAILQDPIMVEVPHSDPSSLWYRAYSSSRDARALESKGDRETARKKYRESKHCYDVLNREFPELKSEHIKNGSELLTAKLNKMLSRQ